MFESSWSHVNVLCGGPLPEGPIAQPLIAVDGGLAHCERLALEPEMVVGDMDSVTPELLERFSHIPQVRFPREKDLSDLELALQQVEAERYTVYGALEGRTDHLLSNLSLLTRYPVEFIGVTERLFAVGLSYQGRCSPGQTISLMPLGVVEGVTTEGLQWELQEARLDQSFVSLSNVATGEEFQVEVARGTLICVEQRVPPSRSP